MRHISSAQKAHVADGNRLSTAKERPGSPQKVPQNSAALEPRTSVARGREDGVAASVFPPRKHPCLRLSQQRNVHILCAARRET